MYHYPGALVPGSLCGFEHSIQRNLLCGFFHCGQGLEFDTVFLPELTDERLPGRRADAGEEDMEEERRLLYVAMTRAKRRLYMSYAVGERAKSTPSRFLAGLRENEKS